MEKLILAVQKVLMVAGLFAGITIGGHVKAQSLVLPSYAASAWPLSSMPTTPLAGINSAMISYMTMSGSSCIYGITYLDGTAGIFDIQDFGLTPPGTTPFFGGPIGTPDIVIGNNTLNPTTNYIVAVAYPDASGLAIEFWDLYDDGSTASIGTLLGYYTYSGTVTNVHIDLIAQYGVTGGTGLPRSSKFVVTWEDAGAVMAAYGDLNNYTITGSPVTIGTGIMPDVAAIQRIVSMSVHDIALFTYTDAANANLYYNEYDITTSSVLGASTLDAMAMGDAVTIPRIDALDDYVTNGTSSISNYKVVAQVDSNGNNIIRTYDNLTYGTAAPSWTSSSVITLPGGYSPPPYQHYAPTVALGGPAASVSYPHDGTQYMVQHFTDYSSSTADIVMMEPIDNTTPYYVAQNPVNTFYEYYWVCDHSPDPTTTGVYANAVSTAVNDAVYNSVHVWGQDDFMGGTNIKYKLTPYCYSFKKQPTGSGTSSGAWQIFPNPATDFVTINCPSEKDGAYYQVVDMPGHIVLNGKLQNGNQQVSLASLVPGTYILKLGREDGAGKQTMFVKQ